MAYFHKVSSFFATIMRRKSHSGSTDPDHIPVDQREDTLPTKGQTPLQDSEDSGDDPFAALSEVAAPEPVQRLSDAEVARHPSLQQGFANYRGGPYGSLSEVAAPEPVQRLSEAEVARHPSLQQGYANYRGDPYGNVSKVTAPEPVERLTEEDKARHPSLEQRFSRISRQ